MRSLVNSVGSCYDDAMDIANCGSQIITVLTHNCRKSLTGPPLPAFFIFPRSKLWIPKADREETRTTEAIPTLRFNFHHMMVLFVLAIYSSETMNLPASVLFIIFLSITGCLPSEIAEEKDEPETSSRGLEPEAQSSRSPDQPEAAASSDSNDLSSPSSTSSSFLPIHCEERNQSSSEVSEHFYHFIVMITSTRKLVRQTQSFSYQLWS